MAISTFLLFFVLTFFCCCSFSSPLASAFSLGVFPSSHLQKAKKNYAIEEVNKFHQPFFVHTKSHCAAVHVHFTLRSSVYAYAAFISDRAIIFILLLCIFSILILLRCVFAASISSSHLIRQGVRPSAQIIFHHFALFVISFILLTLRIN